jgi:RNA polymerase sigma-70 factor (ECF subfamily)
MEFRSTESAIESVISAAAEPRRCAEPSLLEAEVTGLFDEFRPSLLRYLSSFRLSGEDCEEIVQEVFVSLFLHLRAAKSRSNIRGWIFRVAHNQGLKRRQAIHRVQKSVSAMNEYAESQWSAVPDPEQHFAALQQWERVLAVVNILPEQDRRCLYLRAEGLRYREIASVLDMSLGGVALSLARSLSRLQREARGRQAEAVKKVDRR